jgi:hypothetical protein
MNRTFGYLSLLMLCLFSFGAQVQAEFDARYWEQYAEIDIPNIDSLPPLAGISLEPWLFEGTKPINSMSDLRILTDTKVEIPYQIVTRDQQTKSEELPVKVLNLSITKQNETYFVGYIDLPQVVYNELEIITPAENFYRQVQVLGSMDGKEWNQLRRKAVIFNYHKEELIQHTTITFPDSVYKYLSVRIMNAPEKPLKILGLKVYYQQTEPGITTPVNLWITKQEEKTLDRESIVFLNQNSYFPARKIKLETPDTNFQRRIEIYAKPGNSEDWQKLTETVIFNFDTDKIKAANLELYLPEVFTKELKLVIQNYDSPPIRISNVIGSSYRKDLIFKLDNKQKYYLFWGNPEAKTPQYDISELIVRHGVNDIPIYSLGMKKKNTGFIGLKQRLPFTERYKYLLYGIVVIVILGLILLQYSVIHSSRLDSSERTDKKSDKNKEILG